MHLTRRILALALLFGVASVSLNVQAQQRKAQPGNSPRKLAPGVLTVIPQERLDADAATGPVPVPEIVEGMKHLSYKPNFEPMSKTVYERAKRLMLRRDVWCLEFAFKSLRMIEVDLPAVGGGVDRKKVWYLFYRVKNVGNDLHPVPVSDTDVTAFKIEKSPGAERRFFPVFELYSHDLQKKYVDQVIPQAQAAIVARERPGLSIRNSVTISQIPIPLSDEQTDRSIWGVAMWTGVDPRTDFFSIYVHGLTNASDYTETPGAYKPGDPPGTGRVYRFRVLELNFWRPGDAYYEHEEEFRYGVPVDSKPEVQKRYLESFGLEQRVDYRWIYR